MPSNEPENVRRLVLADWSVDANLPLCIPVGDVCPSISNVPLIDVGPQPATTLVYVPFPSNVANPDGWTTIRYATLFTPVNTPASDELTVSSMIVLPPACRVLVIVA